MSKYRWVILSILLYATTVNYLDRFLLGLLKDTLMQDLNFSEAQYGKIVAAFQISYGIGNLIMGYVIDRLGTKIGFVLTISIWSLSSLSHAFAKSWIGLAVSRVFLGFGESGNFPAAIKTVAEWFPKKERALATGIFNSGSQLGIILAGLIIPVVLLEFGWRACFLVTSILSIIWIVLWVTNYKSPLKHKKVSAKELEHIQSDSKEESTGNLTVWQLLKYKQTWAIAFAKLFSDPVWWFYLFWGASFLDKKFQVDIHEIALPLIVIYVIADAGGIFFGGLSSRFIKKGLSINKSRKITLLTCVILILPVMFVSRVESSWLAIFLIAFAAAGHCGWAANVFTLASDVFPKQAVGRVVGFGGAFSTFGAAIASIGVGKLLNDAPVDGYQIPFFVAATGYVLALIIIQLVMPEIQSISVHK